MHCIQCGTELPTSAAFCPGCGRARQQAARVSYFGGLGTLATLAILGVVLFLAVIIGLSMVGPALTRHSGSGISPPISQTVVDSQRVLKDGESMSWKVPPGRYRIEMTASDDGASVEWLGADCPATQAMRELNTTCEMNREGQLIIRNPTTFGLGAPVSVTIKVTKLGILSN